MILVTGGAGFIGLNFVKYMLDKGEDILVIDTIIWNISDMNSCCMLANRIDFAHCRRNMFDMLQYQVSIPEVNVNV